MNREAKHNEAMNGSMEPYRAHIEGCKDCLGARECRKGRRLFCASMRAAEAITIR